MKKKVEEIVAKAPKGRARATKRGRNKNWCAMYLHEHRYEKNKKRKLLKHIKKFPNDKVAINRLTTLIW